MQFSPRNLRVASVAALIAVAGAVSAFSRPARTVLTPRFNHVMLYVSNLDSSITFYTTAFDLKVSQRITEMNVTAPNGTTSTRPAKMALLKFPGQEFVLELAERPAAPGAPPSPHYQHLGVDVTDIQAAADRLVKAGATGFNGIATVRVAGTQAKNAFFRGPSGELVELMQIISGEF